MEKPVDSEEQSREDRYIFNGDFSTLCSLLLVNLVHKFPQAFEKEF